VTGALAGSSLRDQMGVYRTEEPAEAEALNGRLEPIDKSIRQYAKIPKLFPNGYPLGFKDLREPEIEETPKKKPKKAKLKPRSPHYCFVNRGNLKVAEALVVRQAARKSFASVNGVPSVNEGVWVREHDPELPAPVLIWFPYKTGADSTGTYWRSGNATGNKIFYFKDADKKQANAIISWLHQERRGADFKAGIFNRFRKSLRLFHLGKF